MKKLLTLSIAAVAVVVTGFVQPAAAETLRVGMECTYAPFNFRNGMATLMVMT